MASVRKLKKAVNSLADQLIEECNIYKKYHPKYEVTKLDEIIIEINSKRETIIQDINKTANEEDKKNQFEKVVEEFQNTMIPILDKLVN